MRRRPSDATAPRIPQLPRHPSLDQLTPIHPNPPTHPTPSKPIGLLELCSAVGFNRPDSLTALTALTSLSVRLVPLPIIDALPSLPNLRSLHLLQTAPVTPRQAAALARCRGLSRLELQPLPWELVPCLAPLDKLRALSLQLRPAARGTLPAAAADALLALQPLSQLQTFAFSGQVALQERHIAALAAAWPGLKSLDLCCGLAGGTLGFHALASLRRLRLSPYHWDVWSHEAPLLLHPAELPETLTCLEARDVWVATPGAEAARLSAGRCSDFSWDGVSAAAMQQGGGGGDGGGCGGGGFMAASSHWGSGGGADGMGSRSMSASSLASSASSSSAAAAASGWAPRRRPSLCRCGSEAGVAGCMCQGKGSAPPPPSSPCVTPSHSSCSLLSLAAQPPAPPPELTPAQRAAALTLSTPRLRRLVLRCVSVVRAEGGSALLLPRLDRVTALEQLDLHHSQISSADLEAITTGPAARTLRALRLVASDDGVKLRGAALAKLTRLTALESLQVGVGFWSVGWFLGWSVRL